MAKSGRLRTDRRTAQLYTIEQRQRRDATVWTLVQGMLAPVQFLVFLVSVGLILRYLATGEGLAAANASIVVKTLLLYTIMITGSIWEKVVFGRWLFADAFFWEDVVSHAGSGAAHGLPGLPLPRPARPGGADAAGARSLRDLRGQRRTVHPEAARGAALRTLPAHIGAMEVAR